MNERIVAKSIKVWGKEIQSIVAMEECSELIQQVSKELRGKSNINHLTEEMADVLISIEILRQIYGIEKEDIARWIDMKQKRTLHRMADAKKQ